MASSYSKPENALKRAEELMNVGQKAAALQALHDLITSKRYRAWQKPLERIMFKYVELCVDMRKGRFAKDGLIQYRIVCQQVNVSSLEEVIKHFLQLSTERAEQAQSQVQATILTFDVEDLEAEMTPENLMLSYVSGERGRERSDKEVVTPWIKFLWETYRTVLEILRNNSKLEALYAMTAHRAFQFCLQYKRTTEFRRLCDILRNHLANLNKYRDQRDRPDLSQPESLQLYVDTRLEQLKVATELELWQEAFRTVEDIHGLMSMVKKTPKPQMMAVYYAKLIKIFWMSESHLYHAYAWYKLYNLQKSYNKNLTTKDLQLMAASVLLATLAVLPYDKKYGAHHFELEMEKDRNVRMANLLGFSLDPKRDSRELLSRSALLSELVSKGVLTYVPQEVKDLYNLLENEFHPVDLASKVEPLLSNLSRLSDKLSSASPVPEVQVEQYVPALENLTTLRVLQQVSQVYQTMRIPNLSKMIPFFNFPAVERLAVDAVKYNYFQMKVDYLNGVVHFGSQDLESDKIRNHLTILAKRLNKAVGLIHPPQIPSTPRQQFPELLMIVEKDHKKLLARKVIIEKRKEDQERQLLKKEQDEERKKQLQYNMNQQIEKDRLQSEAEQRRMKILRDEMQQKEKEDTLQLIHSVAMKNKKNKLFETFDENLTKEQLLERAKRLAEQEKRDAERKLQKMAKQLDYFERAKRENERSLIETAYLKRQEDDRVFYQQQEQQAIEQSRVKHAEDLREKNRLMRMLEEKERFQRKAEARRQGEVDRLRKLREDQREEERSIRREERIRRRKMEYYRRQEEARILKLKEEEEARKREEEERKRIELEERRRKLDEIAAKQRQREAEAEEKARKEREALMEKPSSRFTPFRRGGVEPPAEDRSDSWNRAPPAATPVPAAAAAAAPASTGAGRYQPPTKRSGDLPPRDLPPRDLPPSRDSGYRATPDRFPAPPADRYAADRYGGPPDRYGPPVERERERAAVAPASTAAGAAAPSGRPGAYRPPRRELSEPPPPGPVGTRLPPRRRDEWGR